MRHTTALPPPASPAMWITLPLAILVLLPLLTLAAVLLWLGLAWPVLACLATALALMTALIH